MPEPDPFAAIKTPWSIATPPSTGLPPADSPPITIPDHTLLRRIGKGSYGEVWLARNVLGIYRAVKIVHRSAFDNERPFEREFAGIQRFEPVSRSHESQLNILHVGRGPDCFYYIMELADDMRDALPASTAGFPTSQSTPQSEPTSNAGFPTGEPQLQSGPTGKSALQPDTYTPRNLRSELLLRGRLPVDECIRLGLALTTALEHLHRHGLVHRDIKPSNIIFVSGIPKLADIGLVAQAEATMSFVGTEGYLPPEGPGTVQADLFSLGKVLYEIATGHDRQQFPDLPTNVSELPDRAALAELNEVLVRACAPDVKQRYESAAEMHADLALLQSGKSVARMRMMERRLHFVARAGAVVTVLAALAAGAFLYQQVQTREARRLASENRALAEEKGQLAEENRERIVRLDIANGVRLLDDGDPSGALLWFADALPRMTDKRDEKAVHRIRIQEVLNQTPRVLHVLRHGSAALASAFHPDGRRVATGTVDGYVQVWDLDTETPLWSPKQVGSVVLQVRFSPDGRRLLVSSSPPLECAANTRPAINSAAVLDADSGQSLSPVISSNLVWSTFSPDGRWIASAMSDHVINLVDAQDGRLICKLPGHTREVTRCSFSADGSVMASASLDQTVRLWHLPSGEPIGNALRHEGPVSRVALTEDAQKLATSTKPGSRVGESVIQVWNPETGQKIGDPIIEKGPVVGLFFDKLQGNHLFVAASRPEVRVWEAGRGSGPVATLPMREILGCWAFSTDGLRVAVGSDDQTARIWSAGDGELLFPPFRHTGWLQSVCFSRDGTRLLTCGNEGTTKVWALNLQKESAKVRLVAPLMQERPDHTLRDMGQKPGPLPVFTTDGTVRLIDPGSLAEVNRLVPSQSGTKPNRCIVAPGGRQWAVFYWEDRRPGEERFTVSRSSTTVDLWRERGGNLHHLALEDPAEAEAVSFSPSEDRLLVARAGGWISVWKTADGVLERAIPLPVRDARVWCFSSDVKRALIILKRSGPGSVLDLLEVLDIESGKPIGEPFRCPVGEDFAFDPQGNRIAAVSQDSYLRIFDAFTGQLVSPSFKHSDSLRSVEWSADGRLVLAAGVGQEATTSDPLTGGQYLAPFHCGTRGLIARWSADNRFITTRNEEGFVRVWDALRVEAVTPLLRHREFVRFASVTQNNRLITLSDPDLLRAWDLTEASIASDLLVDYAKLLSGRRLSATGVILPLKPDELAELSRSLRVRAPELFWRP